jgi:hypothetical protein
MPPVPIADPAEQIRYQQLVPIQSTSYFQRLPPTEPQLIPQSVSPASYERPPPR